MNIATAYHILGPFSVGSRPLEALAMEALDGIEHASWDGDELAALGLQDHDKPQQDDSSCQGVRALLAHYKRLRSWAVTQRLKGCVQDALALEHKADQVYMAIYLLAHHPHDDGLHGFRF